MTVALTIEPRVLTSDFFARPALVSLQTAGIAPEAQRGLFQAFTQVDGSYVARLTTSP